jgi:hypothetical protein
MKFEKRVKAPKRLIYSDEEVFFYLCSDALQAEILRL